MVVDSDRRLRPSAERAAVCVTLLNQFEVRAGHLRVDLSSSASRLVAYLALQDRVVSRATVAGELWPDSTQEKAQASLRTACWRARRANEAVVVAEHDSLALDPRIRVDVRTLTDISRRLDQGVGLDNGTNEPPPSVIVGELLPDWHDDWVTLERERFRLLSLNTLERVSDWYRDHEQFTAAAESALAAIRLEPLRESAHRALIATHLEQGNLGEAVRQFRTFRRNLRRELGVEPSQAMASLLRSAGLAQTAGVAG